MRQADLARPGDRPSSHQARITDSMVRRPKRPSNQKRARRRNQARHRMDFRDLD